MCSPTKRSCSASNPVAERPDFGERHAGLPPATRFRAAELSFVKVRRVRSPHFSRTKSRRLRVTNAAVLALKIRLCADVDSMPVESHIPGHLEAKCELVATNHARDRKPETMALARPSTISSPPA
jgi:hypothetical protein